MKIPNRAKAAAYEAAPKLTMADIRRAAGSEDFADGQDAVLRFAPSPTGDLHIGNARTALLNFLAARKLGGKFVLRIEDTDGKRSKTEYTEALIDALRWLGIESDAPILYQSQRMPLYADKVDDLIRAQKAYRDETGAVRFKMPEEGSVIVVNDHVRGRVPVTVSEKNGTTDYIIQRADGTATFLLANAVDDGEQGVTHVIRGNDHLINAARQIPLIQALGYRIPEWFHVSLIHGDDGAKLSKRHGAPSVLEYRDAGYAPEALVNHLARLGLGFETQDTMPVERLATQLRLESFSKAPAKMGFAALDERNRRALASLDAEVLKDEVVQRDAQLATRLGPNGLEALVDAARVRASTFSEIVELGRFLTDAPVYTSADEETFAAGPAKDQMRALAARLESLPAERWSLQSVEEILNDFNREEDLTFSAYQLALRWMLTGIPEGFPLHHTLALLGRDESLARLQAKSA